MLSKKKLFVLFFEIILINLFLLFNVKLEKDHLSKNKQQQIEIVYSNNNSKTPRPQAIIEEKPQVLSLTSTESPPPSTTLSNNSYKIAIYGDSMIETMGDNLDFVNAKLKQKYPNTKFEMYNYGIGGEKVDAAVARFEKPFVRGGRNYPNITSLKPDILIVGSYAYNPFDLPDRDRHWLTLAGLLQKAKLVTPNVYILAEVAPLKEDFGKGPNGVNWPIGIILDHTAKILDQMDNAIGLSSTLNIPLINVYDKTRANNSRFGKREYVSENDGVHPSVLGHEFTAKQVVSTIKLN